MIPWKDDIALEERGVDQLKFEFYAVIVIPFHMAGFTVKEGNVESTQK